MNEELCAESYFHSPQQVLGCSPPCLRPLHVPQFLKPRLRPALGRDFLFVSAGIREDFCHQHNNCSFHPALDTSAGE